MAVSKKPRKKYRPKEVLRPVIVEELLRGRKLSDREHALLDCAFTKAADLVMLQSEDEEAFNMVDTCCRALYLLAPLYDGDEERRTLAQLGRLALWALWMDYRREESERLFLGKPNYMKAFSPLWWRIISEAEALLAESTRTEIAIVDRNYANVPDPKCEGAWIITPDGQEPGNTPVGIPGLTYINGELSRGCVALAGKRPAWAVKDGPKLAITDPIFVTLLKEETHV